MRKIKLSIPVDEKCDGVQETFYDMSNAMFKVKEVEDHLEIHSKEQSMNLEAETLKTAAEAFIYLNYCTISLESWLNFYKNLFQSGTPEILLTLNRIMRGPKSVKNRNFNSIAEKLFMNISSKLNLPMISERLNNNIVLDQKSSKNSTIVQGKSQISAISGKEI